MKQSDTPSVPNEMRNELQSLLGPRTLPFVTQLIRAWVVIGCAIYVATSVSNIFVSILAIIVIATRMNILGLLTHEQAHKLGIRGLKGDIFTNIFAAYPLLALSVENYSRVHLSHHKYYFTDKDPDHLRKSGDQWQVPMTGFNLIKLFARDLFGLTIIDTFRGKNKKVETQEFNRAKPTPKWVQIVFFVTLAISLTYFEAWPVFFSLLGFAFDDGVSGHYSLGSFN